MYTKIALWIVLVLVVILIGPFFVQLGWELFMEPVFNMRAITYTEAIGFMLLAASFRSVSK